MSTAYLFTFEDLYLYVDSQYDTNKNNKIPRRIPSMPPPRGGLGSIIRSPQCAWQTTVKIYMLFLCWNGTPKTPRIAQANKQLRPSRLMPSPKRSQKLPPAQAKVISISFSLPKSASSSSRSAHGFDAELARLGAVCAVLNSGLETLSVAALVWLR